MEALRCIGPPGIRPLAGCRAVMGGKCNGYGVWDKSSAQGRELPLTEPWGGLRITCCEAENPGGRSTPLCGNLAAGRQDAACKEKNTGMDAGVFFYLPAPGYGRGLPLPL